MSSAPALAVFRRAYCLRVTLVTHKVKVRARFLTQDSTRLMIQSRGDSDFLLTGRLSICQEAPIFNLGRLLLLVVKELPMVSRRFT
ncbi:uncharacterized protein BCR38DRAFT_438341 [Pseudomassariella vexata]|uniref:Uncharacterized protein n=1 Tax=Pseudomassariella vexata TaxID=1141098 RepID=A0A1Y2DUQ7_9PEZI|nr:uncharacterized protein BCR38DRAFT_438341 [Pseudomassariella vexata]ORY62385.1 hypothetical protein BCR38DRAFT_438341 [Pseudomassariella vexata]